MRLRRLKLLVTETQTGDQAGTDGSALHEVVLELVELNEQGDRHCRLESAFHTDDRAFKKQRNQSCVACWECGHG